MLLHSESFAGSAVIEEVGPLDRAVQQTNRVAVHHAFYRGKAAGELEVPGVGGSGSASGETMTFVQDLFRAYAEHTPVMTSYWGGAVRIAVTVDKWEAKAKLSLPLLAMKAELEEFRAAYRFEVLGLVDFTEIADNLPTVGSFNTQAYMSLVDAANVCGKLLLKAATIDPVLLYVQPEGSDVEEISYTFANVLRAIARGEDVDATDPTAADDVHDWVRRAVLAERDASKPSDPEAWAEARLAKLKSHVNSQLP